MKVRGITPNERNSKVVNFDTLYIMVQRLKTVQEPTTVSITEPYQIARDLKSKNIVTHRMNKNYRIVFGKRWIWEGALRPYRTVMEFIKGKRHHNCMWVVQNQHTTSKCTGKRVE